MGRANIDLSWLASFLTQTPTADNSQNPAFGATQQQYQDVGPTQNGQPLPTEQDYFNKAGLRVNPDDIQKYGTNTPYKTPSAWQQAFKPEASEALIKMNNEYTAKPLFATQANDIQNKIGSSNFGKVRTLMPSQLTNGVSDEQGYLLTGGDLRPTATGTEARALVGNLGGRSQFAGDTDIAEAQHNLVAAKGKLGRQPVDEAALDQTSVNNLAQLLHVDAPTIALNAQRIKAETGLEPTYEQVREYTIQNQLKEQSGLVPMRQQEEALENKFQTHLISSKLGLTPYYDRTLQNQAVGDAATSAQLPVGSKYVNQIQPSGRISTLSKNPMGASPIAMEMANLQDLGNINGQPQTMTLPSGQKIAIKSNPMQSSSYDPLSMGASITPTTRSGGPGQPEVTQPVAPVDTSVFNNAKTNPADAKMSAMVHIQMIDKQLQDPDLAERAQMYPNSELGKKYNDLVRQRQELQKTLDAASSTQQNRPIIGNQSLGMSLTDLPPSLRF